MDLYRIGSTEEFEMIGGEELLYSNGVTLIEWSEKLRYASDSTLYVDIGIMPNQERTIPCKGPTI
jgi:tRNA threonylcarbamoyladenosine biosynthesis protein TsaE